MSDTRSADVVVVGGGIIGLSSAYRLAETGKSVIVVEQGDLGSGSTSRCAGGIRSSFTNEANMALGIYGLEVFAQFEEQFGVANDFDRRGYLYLLGDAAQVEVSRVGVEAQRRHGIESYVIEPDRAKELAPPINTDGLVAAVWSPADALSSPEAAIQGYAAAARRNGTQILQRTGVTGFEFAGERVAAVHTSAGTIATGTVVVAAGAWSGLVGDMLGLTIPVVPVRRRTAFTGPLGAPPARTPLTLDMSTGFWFNSEGSGYLFGWQNADEPSAFDLSFPLDDHWVEGLVERAATRAPEFTSYGIASGWSGYYEVTPDHNQVIDRSPDLENVIIATGFSGHGYQMGPAVGEIVRDIYLEKEPSFDISPFTADRFAVGATTAETFIF